MPSLVAYSKGSSTVVVNSAMASINQVNHYTETGDGNATAVHNPLYDSVREPGDAVYQIVPTKVGGLKGKDCTTMKNTFLCILNL